MARSSWHDVFMRFAKLLATRSCCIKYKTAAVVVRGTQIVGEGYNGTFSKQPECIDVFKTIYAKSDLKLPFYEWILQPDIRAKHREWSKCNEIHAEINALNWISKRDVDSNYVIYTVYSPCDQCAKTIIAYGIKTMYYELEYPNGADAMLLLQNNGVACIKFSDI